MRPINNLHDLSETVTDVVNRILETVTENTSTGQYYVDYDDVSDLISHQDYLSYFDLIAEELHGREEVLDLDTSDHVFDVVCGLAWCPNYELLPDEDFEFGYEQLRPAPSLARLAQIGQKAVDHLVLEDTTAKFKPEDLGITEEELEYTRNNMGLNRERWAEHKMLPPLSASLVTAESYENLLLRAEMQRDRLFHTGVKDPRETVYDVCVNEYGQVLGNTLSTPDKALYAQIFAGCADLCSHCCGAVINGQPSLILSHDLAPSSEDPYTRQAVTAMTAGFVRAMLGEANVQITYGCGTGADGKDDLLAIVPTDVSLSLLHEFDKKFTAVLECSANTWSPYWAATQYDALLQNVKEQMSADPHIAPWTRSNPEQAAIFACESLGEYIGEHQYDADQARLTHNKEKLDYLIHKLDVTTCDKTCDRMTSEGIFTADRDLSRRLCLYTDTRASQDSFLIPKGQLRLALNKLGYEPDYPLVGFMETYTPDAAREVRSVMESLPRLSLFQQVRMAEQSKDTSPAVRPEQEKEPGHEH